MKITDVRVQRYVCSRALHTHRQVMKSLFVMINQCSSRDCESAFCENFLL